METALAFLFVMLAPILLIPFAFVMYFIVGGLCVVVKTCMVDKVAERKRGHANLDPV